MSEKLTQTPRPFLYMHLHPRFYAALLTLSLIAILFSACTPQSGPAG